MATSAAQIRRVREHLSEDLSPVLARAVLFEALTKWGPQIPRDRAELVRFVRGPLREVLQRFVRPEDAVSTLVRIENSLAVVDHTDDDSRPRLKPSTIPPPPDFATVSSDTTRALRPIMRPVRVLVVSSRPSFASTLELSLGTSLVRTEPADTPLALRERLDQMVDVVLIDSGDPPPLEPTGLASLLNRVGPETWIAIWGAELPFGRELSRALEAGGIDTIPFVTREGMAPFVDLVRSRQSS
jgi:hypothetical protein